MADTAGTRAGAEWLEHDRRLTRLETLCESLATKADLERTKSSMLATMFGLQIGTIAVLGGLMTLLKFLG